jgi:hypothetical protein
MRPTIGNSAAPVAPPAYQMAVCFFSFTRPHPPLSGWSTMVQQIALTYTATVIVALAAQQAGRPDLISPPKRILAHVWEGL